MVCVGASSAPGETSQTHVYLWPNPELLTACCLLLSTNSSDLAFLLSVKLSRLYLPVNIFIWPTPLRWPSGKETTSRAADTGFVSGLGDFSESSHTRDLKLGTPVLGLVGPVPVYADRVRQKVGSATSISVRQHVHLFEQIRPTYTCLSRSVPRTLSRSVPRTLV